MIKMKRKLMLGVIGILLVGLVVAGVGNYLKEDRKLDKEDKGLLDDYAGRFGLNKFPNYKVSKIECSLETCDNIILDIGVIGNFSCELEPYYPELINNDTELIKHQYSHQEIKQQLIDCENKLLDKFVEKEKKLQSLDNQQFVTIQNPKDVSIV